MSIFPLFQKKVDSFAVEQNFEFIEFDFLEQYKESVLKPMLLTKIIYGSLLDDIDKNIANVEFDKFLMRRSRDVILSIIKNKDALKKMKEHGHLITLLRLSNIHDIKQNTLSL